MSVTRADLDQMQCQVPGCTHEDHGSLFLTARCHPHAAVEAEYLRKSGTLRITCRTCKRLVAEVAVA